MALLDLQTMDAPEFNGGGHGGASSVSLTLCASVASVTICL
jgi:Lanthionine-containing peptide SapB precursor RamS